MGASARDFYCHTGGGGWTGGSRGALLVWVLLVVNKMEKQGRQVLLNCCFQDAQRLGGTVTRQVDEVLTRYCP